MHFKVVMISLLTYLCNNNNYSMGGENLYYVLYYVLNIISNKNYSSINNGNISRINNFLLKKNQLALVTMDSIYLSHL
jgi:hypothetical protein